MLLMFKEKLGRGPRAHPVGGSEAEVITTVPFFESLMLKKKGTVVITLPIVEVVCLTWGCLLGVSTIFGIRSIDLY